MDEEQYILRLPPPLVERMRFALSSTKRRDAAGEDKRASSFSVNFSDERNAVFTVDGSDYPASLMDLPTIVETHKTADKRTFYKSGDLHQVLVVRMPEDAPPEGTILPHGLTPAAFDGAKRLQPPKRLFSPAQVESVECRVKMVIDHKVKLVPKSNVLKKDLPEDRTVPPPDDMEVVIEEETTVPAIARQEQGEKVGQPAISDIPSSQSTPGAILPLPNTPVIVPGSIPSGSGRTTGMSPATSIDVQPSPLPSAATPGPMPYVATPSAATPLPETEAEAEADEEEDDDDDDDDEFAAQMAGALMEGNDEDDAQKRIERSNLDQKIVEQKKKIADLDGRVAKAPNAVIKWRLLAKRPDLVEVLNALEKEREELGDY